MMADQSQDVSNLMVPFDHGLGIVHTIYEDYEEVCRETSSDGSWSSYTDLLNVGDYEITNVSINVAYSESKCSAIDCSLQSSIRAWCDATGLPVTVSIHVDGKVFELHKFPLVSLSGFLKRQLMESNEVHLAAGWWPGGAESFEVAASFCYGGRVALAPANVAAVRCAAEALEMTEDYSRGNLSRQCDIYLRQVALRRWSDALLVLKQCQNLRPLADNLLIVAHCIETLATMACGQAANAVEIYDLNENLSFNHNENPSFHENGDLPLVGFPIGNQLRSTRNCLCSLQLTADDQLAWIHDLAELPHYQFAPIITTARRLGMREKHVTTALIYYAEKSIFSCFEVNEDGDLIQKIKAPDHPVACATNYNHAALVDNLEAMVRLLSFNQDETALPVVKFLFGLLKCALACGGSADECKLKLECLIARRLQDANMSDFVLPCTLMGGHHSDNLSHDHDLHRRRPDKQEVESMRHIVTLFLSQHGGGPAEKPGDDRDPILAVGALWDEYLADAATDPALNVRKFTELAEMVPPSARRSHDPLYKAIDSYLQSHPHVSQQERLAVCKTLNCQRLSPECCIQAVQNETMPLRIIVQAMFMHQLHVAASRAATPAGPFLQRSASCNHHHQQNNTNWTSTPSSDIPLDHAKKKKTQQLRSLLTGGAVSRPTAPDNVEALQSRLHTLEEEIQRLKRGLAGMAVANVVSQPLASSERCGWRRRFTCLGRRATASAGTDPPAGGMHVGPSLHDRIASAPACCLPPGSSPVEPASASTLSRHHHSF